MSRGPPPFPTPDLSADARTTSSQQPWASGHAAPSSQVHLRTDLYGSRPMGDRELTQPFPRNIKVHTVFSAQDPNRLLDRGHLSYSPHLARSAQPNSPIFPTSERADQLLADTGLWRMPYFSTKLSLNTSFRADTFPAHASQLESSHFVPHYLTPGVVPFSLPPKSQ